MTWADYGKPIAADPEILGAAELVRRLYEDLGECTGGPLHWMLDDGNIYDDQMPDSEEQTRIFAYLWNGDFKRWSQAGTNVSAERRQAIQDTCRGILYAFDRMNEAERTCVLAWHGGDIERELPDWHVKHRTPEHLAGAREQADEFVRLALAAPVGRQASTACASIPCPPFQEVHLEVSEVVSLELDEYSPQTHPTAADLVRAGVDIERFRPPIDLAQAAIDQNVEVPAKPAGRPPSPYDDLRAAMAAALRPPVDPLNPATLPLIVTLPEGVTTDQALEWIKGCQRLGLIDISEAGTLVIPHGVRA